MILHTPFISLLRHRPTAPHCLIAALALLLTLAIGGCAEHSGAARATAIASAQAGLVDNAAIEWPAEQWWRSFNDTQLNGLIERALANNPSMTIAAARVQQAQQAAIAARAIKDPALAANAEINRQRYSENYIYPPPLGGSSVTDARLALDFSYEFDFWGRQRAGIDAALAQLQVEQVEQSAARMVLSIAVAQSYFSLQYSEAELKLAQSLQQQRQATLKLLQLRVERGLLSRAEIQTPTAQLAEATRQAAIAKQRGDALRHQLAALTGQAPESLRDLTPTTHSEYVALAVPTQLPADLLARRADIIAQRLRIEAASQDIKAARADFYPNIDINAFIGLQALGTQKLMQSSSKTYGIGPALHLPIFNRDSLRAQLGARYADYDIAVAQYNDSVLTAVREAADASSALQSLQQQRGAIDTSLQALQRARDIAQLRYKQGLGNYLDVLAADSALIAQRRSAAALQDDQLQAALALIKALGGGYQIPAPNASSSSASSNEVSND